MLLGVKSGRSRRVSLTTRPVKTAELDHEIARLQSHR